MPAPPNDIGGRRALAALQALLGAAPFLEVIHEGGYLWQAHFKFPQGASRAAVDAAQDQVGVPLPPAYREFLEQYNGPQLYIDAQYGQWGYRLYSAERLWQENARWRRRYPETWPSSYVAFAETLGDADLLVLDTAQAAADGKDCRVIDGDSGYLPSQWRFAAPSFSAWVDRLVVAQGAKYWRWA